MIEALCFLILAAILIPCSYYTILTCLELGNIPLLLSGIFCGISGGFFLGTACFYVKHSDMLNLRMSNPKIVNDSTLHCEVRPL